MDKEILKQIIIALENIHWDAVCAGGAYSENGKEAAEAINKLKEISNG